MGVHTGVFVIYYLYRSRYSFVADHYLKDGHHMVDFSNLENALKFQNGAQARRFIATIWSGRKAGRISFRNFHLANCLSIARICMRCGAPH